MHSKRLILIVVALLLLFGPLLRTIRQSGHKKLYVNIKDDGAVKIGTCKHCVLYEQSRPVRAWNANGDAELDFPRDQLLQQLAAFGLLVEIEQEYVCP